MIRRTWRLTAIVLAAAAARSGASGLDSDPRWRAARVDGGRVAVTIELVEEPTALAYARTLAAPVAALSTGDRDTAAADRAAQRQLSQVEAAQQRLLPLLTAPALGAEVIYRVQRVYNGIVAYVDPTRVAALAALPGVKAVHPLVPDKLLTSTSVRYIGAPQVWQGSAGSTTGAGISIGIIDSGIDYLHRDFGGNASYAGQNFADTTVPWNAKVVGGTDLAGDSYTGSNTPKPDGDPMDLQSVAHGTHVAGIAAGYGVEADGVTYGGPYNATEDMSVFLIGPGVAPDARLYAIRVFGSGLSTSLTTQGVEWAIDPNKDGNLSDHLDIINLSLGSEFGTLSNSTVTAVENAAAAGVIVVAAAGNEGDTTFITASPAVAPRTISVAGSYDSGSRGGDLDVVSPSDIAGDLEATAAAFGGGTQPEGITGTLVAALDAAGLEGDDKSKDTNTNACSDLTNVAQIAGKIALIDRGVCTFVSKVKRAQEAGAIGVVVANNVADPALLTMAGSDPAITIPAVLISQADGTRIRAKLPSPGVTATLTAVIYGGLVADFSSRGPRYEGDALKPDITAPGAAITSAYARGGTTGVVFSGTSMATPHVAGVMALLKQLHPTWPAQALKALLMNTGADLYANLYQQPPLQSPVRIGGGLVNLPAAAAATAIAYGADTPDLVSLFFGSFEVTGATSLTRTLTVENRGASEQTFALGYTAVSNIAGVEISFPGGDTITVPAGGSATLTVQLDADAALMNHGVDGAADITQGGRLRYLPAEEAGYVTLTPAAGQALRVPLYASARPVASIAVAESELILGAAQGTATLTLSGTGLDTGGSSAADIESLITPLELQYTGPANAPVTSANATIRYVGVGSDYAAEAGGNLGASTVVFGIATAGNWKTLNEVEFTVRLDTNRDGTFDYSLATVDGVTLASPDDPPGDSFGVRLCQGASGCSWVGYLNRFSPAERDTVVFGTNVVVLAVPASSIGLAAGATAFDYIVESRNSTLGDVSTTSKRTYDVVRPGLAAAVTGPAPARPGALLQLVYDRANYTANGSTGLLLLHHHNAAGSRAQVVPVSASDCTLTCSAEVAATSFAGAPAAFSGSASATGCTPAIAFDWSFGDGTAHGTGAAAEHAYSNPGSYGWTMTASGAGLTCTQSGTIAVSEAPTTRAPRKRVLESLP
jgi:subtilisin family serine protease